MVGFTCSLEEYSQIERLIAYCSSKTIGQLFGLIAERLFTEDDFDENGMLKEGIPAQKFSDMSNLRPGDIKYKDLNGDGEVTAVDKTAIGGTRIP